MSIWVLTKFCRIRANKIACLERGGFQRVEVRPQACPSLRITLAPRRLESRLRQIMLCREKPKENEAAGKRQLARPHLIS
jgi:hypothetical protein